MSETEVSAKPPGEARSGREHYAAREPRFRVSVEQLGILIVIIGMVANWIDMRDRIDRVDKTVVAVEGRIQAQLDRRFNGVNEEINKETDRLIEELDRVERRLDGALTTIGDLRESLTRTQLQLPQPTPPSDSSR